MNFSSENVSVDVKEYKIYSVTEWEDRSFSDILIIWHLRLVSYEDTALSELHNVLIVSWK